MKIPTSNTFSSAGRSTLTVTQTGPQGQVTTTPIHSIHFSCREGLELDTPGRQPALFIDRDGVINRFGKVKKPQDVDRLIYPGALEALVRLMQHSKLPVFIVSNQGNAGASAAAMSMTRLCELIVNQGGKFEAIYYSPDKKDPISLPPASQSGRKPNPGMFWAAGQDQGSRIDLADSYMIGDSVKDQLAAKAAHSKMQVVMVRTGNGGKDQPRPYEPESWAQNLPEAVDWILAQEASKTAGR